MIFAALQSGRFLRLLAFQISISQCPVTRASGNRMEGGRRPKRLPLWTKVRHTSDEKNQVLHHIPNQQEASSARRSLWPKPCAEDGSLDPQLTSGTDLLKKKKKEMISWSRLGSTSQAGA